MGFNKMVNGTQVEGEREGEKNSDLKNNQQDSAVIFGRKRMNCKRDASGRGIMFDMMSTEQKKLRIENMNQLNMQLEMKL